MPAAVCEAQTVTPPTIVSITPSANSVDVPINTSIRVEFSEPIVSVDLDLTLADSLIAGNVTSDGVTATFTPNAALSFNALHKITVKNTVDFEGDSQVGEFFGFFATEAARPQIVVTPNVLDYGISTGQGVVRSFTISNTGTGLLEVKNISTEQH